MSIVESLRTYLATYTGLKTGAPLWVDFLGNIPDQYGIVPLPGEKVIERYINGGSLRQYDFAFQSTVSTADDIERLGTNAFFEALSDWFESQTENGALPLLSTGKTAVSISAMNWGYLMEEGQSETGIYQISCRLVYEQQP